MSGHWIHLLVGFPVMLAAGHFINGHDGMLFAALGYIVGMLATRR